MDRDDVIECKSVINWKDIIVSCKIRFCVCRDGVIKCDSVMNLERYNYILLDSVDKDRDNVISYESVMNWKGIIVSFKIRFYVSRNGVTL